MGARFAVPLMLEWGGGCLWGGNDAARERFDVGPIEDVLPLQHQCHRNPQARRHEKARATPYLQGL
jgi:hypothetical protein